MNETKISDVTRARMEAFLRRADNIRRDGSLGELLYEPLLDGPPVDVTPRPFVAGLQIADRELVELYCEIDQRVTEHRFIPGGVEAGVVYCLSCGWGYANNEHYDRALHPIRPETPR